MQIKREPVADIHAGGCFSDELAADIQTRADVALVTPASQRAGNVDAIAGRCTGAAQSFAFTNGSADHDIANQLIGMRDVAARELRLGLAQQFIHSAIETIDPMRIRPVRERERDQTVQWTSPHGGDIAQATRDGPASNLLGRGFTREMHAFDAEISCKKQILISGSLDYGAIVSDEWGIASELADNGVFVHEAVAATRPEKVEAWLDHSDNVPLPQISVSDLGYTRDGRAGRR